MYVADFVRTLPLTHPIKFTLLYYTHYPSLGLIHWPPVFYITEGFAFLLGGLSVIPARAVILLFTLIGCYFWFKTIEIFENPYHAAVSTMVLGLLPSVLLYEKTVMLEVPSLAMCIAASYYWIRYLRWGHGRDLSFFVAMAILALLTKQTSIYLFLFCVLTILSEKKWRLVLDRSIWRGFGVFFLITAPFYIVALRFHSKFIQSDTLEAQTIGNPFAFYLRALPDQLGMMILCLSILGILTSIWWGKWETTRVMLAWILACYLTMTAFAIKEPRYAIYWIPALVYFAVGPFVSLRLPRLVRLAGGVVSLFLLAYSVVVGWVYERPYISGYAEAAEEVTKMSNSGFLLFDGEFPGNFIFFIHRFDPNRRFVVLRKALYTTRVLKERGSIEFINNQEELENLIDLYGIRLIVVDNSKLEFESQKLLRDHLQSPRFKLVHTVSIKTNIPEMQGRRLFVYENVQPTGCHLQSVHTEMMTLPFNIDISPTELGLECGPSEFRVP
jgi:4-amino-4-deoxy-L-arabinose transferase-like glycosyltransferase